MKKYLFLSVCLVLSSCNGMMIQSTQHSSFYKFSQTPWIEIKQTLQVKPENARVYLQNGKQIVPDKRNLYQTSCEIEVKKVLEIEQSISPAHFKIINISIEESPLVFLMHSRIQYAAGGNNAPVDMMRIWKFKLQSKQYPEVLFMICRGAQDSPANAELPTVEEIKYAVGENIEVHLTP